MSIFNLTSADLQTDLGVSDRPVFVWFSTHPDGYPEHVVQSRGVKNYTLADVVARLRDARKRGLHGGLLRDMVDLDVERRATRGVTGPAAHLGTDLPARATIVLASLSPKELVRFVEVRTHIRAGVLTAFWNRIANVDSVTYDLAVLHPSVLLMVLTGEADELPDSAAEWVSWSTIFVLTNAPSATIEALAA